MGKRTDAGYYDSVYKAQAYHTGPMKKVPWRHTQWDFCARIIKAITPGRG